MKFANPEEYKKALVFARKEVEAGRPHTLLLEDVWPSELIDAQRFLSLYTPESSEEIFTYGHTKKMPEVFKSVRIPMFVLLAEADEYGDQPAEQIKKWFDETNQSTRYRSVIVNAAPHNLKGSEKQVCKEIQDWVAHE